MYLLKCIWKTANNCHTYQNFIQSPHQYVTGELKKSLIIISLISCNSSQQVHPLVYIHWVISSSGEIWRAWKIVSMYVYCGVAKSKYSLILECPSLTSKCYLMVMHNWFMKKVISNIFTSVFLKIILSAPIKWLNKVVLLSKPKLNKYETWLDLQLGLFNMNLLAVKRSLWKNLMLNSYRFLNIISYRIYQ